MAEPQRPQPTGQPTSLPAMVNDLWETVLAYGRQETVDPLKQLGKYIGFGVAGGVSFSIGLLTLTLGGLRALQFELGRGPKVPAVVGQGHLSGNYIWVPYFGAALFCAIVAVVVGLRIRKIWPSEER